VAIRPTPDAAPHGCAPLAPILFATIAALGSPVSAAVPQERAPAMPPETEEGVQVPPEVDSLVFESILTLMTPPASGDAPDPDELRQRVVACGSGAIPIICGVLCGEIALPQVTADEVPQPVHPKALALRYGILRDSLHGLDAAAVVDHLALRGGADATLEMRLVCARLLGPIEHDRALDVLLELSEGIESIHLKRAYVRSAFEGALAQQLARVQDDQDQLHRLDRKCGFEQRALLVRAAGSTSTQGAIRYLASLIGRDEDLDRLVVREVARIAAAQDVVLDAFHLTGLRQLIFSADPELRRLATAALGALGDVDSFELLTGFLDSSDPIEQGTARRSLQDISGVDLGAESKSWTSWYEAEQTWWDKQARNELDRLRSVDPREIHAAMAALVRHPLFRDSISDELGPLASHEDSVVASSACRALARLRSPAAIPWLIEVLADDDEARRKHAADVLRGLTGLDLPPDHQAWTRELGPRALLR